MAGSSAGTSSGQGRTARLFARSAGTRQRSRGGWSTGKRVEIESDVVKRDRYGRRLAYLWLLDGRMVNVEIMREGYAQTLTVPPNVRYERVLRECQREAREAGRGRWSR